KLDALLEAVAENTTTLIDVQQQAAATSASTKDARNYIQTVARQTSWETNGKVIASVLTTALEKDHTALHAASRAAQEMRGLSVELTRKADRAAETQQEASNKFHFAAERLLRVAEAHEQGKWRRMGGMALIAALCGAVGFFAREPASKFDHLWEARTALKQDVTNGDCKTLDGINLMIDGARACVIKEDPV
ncbi:MAG: hypothetical protein WBA51_17360, partial [Erythrobacter sp.]